VVGATPNDDSDDDAVAFSYIITEINNRWKCCSTNSDQTCPFADAWPGASIVVPPGRYQLSPNLPVIKAPNVHLVAHGAMLQAKKDPVSERAFLEIGPGANRFHMEGGVLWTGSSSWPLTGLKINGAYDALLEHVEIRLFKTGVHVTGGAFYNVFKNLVVRGISGTAVKLDEQANDNHFDGGRIGGFTGIGVHIDGAADKRRTTGNIFSMSIDTKCTIGGQVLLTGYAWNNRFTGRIEGEYVGYQVKAEANTGANLFAPGVGPAGKIMDESGKNVYVLGNGAGLVNFPFQSQ